MPARQLRSRPAQAAAASPSFERLAQLPDNGSPTDAEFATESAALHNGS
jgi:hypothetical protein